MQFRPAKTRRSPVGFPERTCTEDANNNHNHHSSLFYYDFSTFQGHDVNYHNLYVSQLPAVFESPVDPVSCGIKSFTVALLKQSVTVLGGGRSPTVAGEQIKFPNGHNREPFPFTTKQMSSKTANAPDGYNTIIPQRPAELHVVNALLSYFVAVFFN